MASKQMLVAVVAAAALAFLPGLAVGTEHMVGDDKGWTLNFNYTVWADTKQFVVGDTLVFKYNSAAHNVVEVGGPDFLSCTQPANAVVWATGEDRVTLDKAGRKWFFCAVGQHCQNGMKLKITILESAAPSNPAGKLQARFGEAAVVVTALAAAVLML
ncbi:blue copper protein 1a-like [Hordeum vulgare subsp. vulgare]|uniref:Phytocyanin domain-containing protein n=1 Tax=Hordeum vulgare subsp. vulgare TaxID=112509 RepID=A0A8I6YVV1_HORVV|nr:blue copper protein 1a-like [Hordeum vulgare subsp. vulgare]